MVKHHITKNVIHPPKKVESVPNNAQWLAGEGAGSWFVISSTSEQEVFFIARFSPDGKLECEGSFKCHSNEKLNLNQPYIFTHLSHCKTVNIVQSGIIFKFERL